MRLQQIINVFLRHGFGRIIDQIHLGRYIPFRKRLKAFGQWPDLKEPTIPERLREAFEELGPSFVKLAQILSSRPDLITHAFADEFKKLQDEVPPFSSIEALAIVEQELGRPVSELFSAFEGMPLAAASIAQVHFARLTSGEDVIVKVQRPGIKEQILTDIEIIGAIARLLERHVPESRFFNPMGIVQEFARTVKKEMDFTLEARHCIRFGRNLEGIDHIYIPKVYDKFLTDKVLVMERVDGLSIDEIEGLRASGHDTRVLAGYLVGAYLKMVLVDGFFHADPHPGNLFVREDGYICFMDFGMVGWVTEETKDLLASSFQCIVRKDYDGMIENYVALGYLPDDTDIETFRREFKADLMDFLEPLWGRSIHEINIVECMNTVINMASRHRLRVPTDLLMINRTLFLFDNLVRQLDPEFDILEAATPYARGFMREKLDPLKRIKRFGRELSEAGEMFATLPSYMNRLLKKAVRDELRVKISLTGMENFIRDMDRSSNRIAFAMVISAIILSSAIMHAMGTGPKVLGGLSLLGIITFAGAFLMGIWLLISIIRSGRL